MVSSRGSSRVTLVIDHPIRRESGCEKEADDPTHLNEPTGWISASLPMVAEFSSRVAGLRLRSPYVG
jgi:hypothetical protein